MFSWDHQEQSTKHEVQSTKTFTACCESLRSKLNCATALGIRNCGESLWINSSAPDNEAAQRRPRIPELIQAITQHSCDAARLAESLRQ